MHAARSRRYRDVAVLLLVAKGLESGQPVAVALGTDQIKVGPFVVSTQPDRLCLCLLLLEWPNVLCMQIDLTVTHRSVNTVFKAQSDKSKKFYMAKQHKRSDVAHNVRSPPSAMLWAFAYFVFSCVVAAAAIFAFSRSIVVYT